MKSYLSAEDKARVEIDKMLDVAGWAVQDARDANRAAARGVARPRIHPRSTARSLHS
jgi:hypothetical protein